MLKLGYRLLALWILVKNILKGISNMYWHVFLSVTQTPWKRTTTASEDGTHSYIPVVHFTEYYTWIIYVRKVPSDRKMVISRSIDLVRYFILVLFQALQFLPLQHIPQSPSTNTIASQFIHTAVPSSYTPRSLSSHPPRIIQAGQCTTRKGDEECMWVHVNLGLSRGSGGRTDRRRQKGPRRALCVCAVKTQLHGHWPLPVFLLCCFFALGRVYICLIILTHFPTAFPATFLFNCFRACVCN